MYPSFRKKPSLLGYLDNVFNGFTEHGFYECYGHDADDPMDEILNKMDEKEKRSENEVCFILFYVFLIQVSLTCKARRRSRGEVGVITNKMSHMINGNRGHFLDCLFQNIPGKQSKQRDKRIAIETILDSHKPTLLGVAEPSTDDLEKMRIRGYKLVKGNMKRGRNIRLHVFIKDGVDFKIERFCSDVPACLIKIQKFKFLFYYREWRREGKKDTDKMELQELRWADFLEKVEKIKGQLVMLGDTNICDIYEDTAHQKSLGNLRDMMRDKLCERGMTQMIKATTRHLEGHKSACLDHVFTKEGKHVVRTYNKNTTGFDHNMIGLRVRIDKPVFIPHTIVRRDIDGVDPLVFHQIWHQYNPWEITAEGDPEKAAEIFEFKLNAVIDTVAPKKIFRARESYAPWMTSDMRKRKIQRDLMHAEAVETGDWTAYKAHKSRLRDDLRKAEFEWKTQYLDFEADGMDDKEGWRRLKLMAGAENKKANIVLEIDGKETDDPKIVAEELNNFYVEKIDGIVKEYPPDPVEVVNYMHDYLADKKIGRFNFRTVGNRSIRRAIMSLNQSEATGIDGIAVKWLKRFVHTLTPFMRHLVNQTIDTSEYPERYKAGCISPLPKKGDLKQKKNWRPVTLLSTCSRVVEKILNSQMKSYLKEYSLLPPTQHAYLTGKSTTSAWSDLDFFVSRARDEGRHVSMLCQDMSSAFNTVDASVILPKMRMMGFMDNSLRLVASYMSGRTNRTRVSNHVTEPRNVFTGIGEGSVLGPATFLLCVIDGDVVIERTRARVLEMFPTLNQDDIRFHVVSFADDISGLVDCTDPNAMRAALSIMSEEYRRFFTAQGLKVNPDKEEHITWGKSLKDRAEVTLMGRDSASSVKLLGIVVDNSYSFMAQAVNVTRKMMERISYLYRVRDYVNRKILIMTARSLIFSLAEYGIEIFARAPAVQKKLQKVQNTVLRVITHSDRMTSVRKMLIDTEQMNMELTYRYYLLMSVERLIATEGSSLEMQCLRKGQCHQYNTRTKSLLAEWRPYSMIGYQSHLLSALKCYNELKIGQCRWDDWEDLKKVIKNKVQTSYSNGNL